MTINGIKEESHEFVQEFMRRGNPYYPSLTVTVGKSVSIAFATAYGPLTTPNPDGREVYTREFGFNPFGSASKAKDVKKTNGIYDDIVGMYWTTGETTEGLSEDELQAIKDAVEKIGADIYEPFSPQNQRRLQRALRSLEIDLPLRPENDQLLDHILDIPRNLLPQAR